MNLEDKVENKTARLSDRDRILDQCRSMTREKISEIIDINGDLINTQQGRIIFEEQIYGVLLQMLAYFRSNMDITRKERQRQGIAAARAAGVHLGRKQRFIAENYIDIYRQLENGEIDTNSAISQIGSCRTTFVKMHKELKEKNLL